MSVSLTPLATDRFDVWREGVKRRLIDRSQESGLRLGDDAIDFAETFVRDLLPDGHATPTSSILMIEDESVELGTIWLVVSAGKLFVVDVGLGRTLTAAHRDELFAGLRVLAGQRDVSRISMTLFPQDAEGHAFIEGRGASIASIQMVLEPLPERDVAPRINVVPMTADRFESFVVHSEAAFADDLVASGRYDATSALAESQRQMRLELPQGIETEGQKFFVGFADGVEVGILWIGERRRDGRPHVFVLDIEVAEDQRRRGYGRELMLAVEREARLLGANSVGLHVFGFNTAAVELYESLGYRRVEETYLLEL